MLGQGFEIASQFDEFAVVLLQDKDAKKKINAMHLAASYHETIIVVVRRLLLASLAKCNDDCGCSQYLPPGMHVRAARASRIIVFLWNSLHCLCETLLFDMLAN